MPLPPNAAGERSMVDVGDYRGEYLRTVDTADSPFSVFRPTVLRLAQPEEAIFDSTSTSPQWEAILEPIGTGTSLNLPTTWSRFITDVSFHMHAEADGVSICRYTRRPPDRSGPKAAGRLLTSVSDLDPCDRGPGRRVRRRRISPGRTSP